MGDIEMSKLDWSLCFIALCLISFLLGVNNNFIVGLLLGFNCGILIHGGKK
jgi:hypothetical protein